MAGIGLLQDRKLWEVLERPQRVERFIYRHHRLFGGIIVAGAMVMLAFLVGGHGLAGTVAWRASSASQMALMAVWALAAFALIIGIFIGIRPSALKGFEAIANRWIQLFPAIPLTSRQIGVLLLIAGIACLWRAVPLIKAMFRSGSALPSTY
jgi:hypothetical protein